MDKSLNQRMFEEVLEPMFPGEFEYTDYDDFISDNNNSFYFSGEIEDAFWLAEKVGLFNGHGQRIRRLKNGNHHMFSSTYDAVGETIPEVICKAILEIYGKKEI